MAGGGSIRLEITVDGKSRQAIRVAGIGPEGTRLVLSTIQRAEPRQH